MKKLLIFFIAMLFCVFTIAQKTQPATVSNGGGNMNISEVKAGFTIGQPVTGAIANGSVIFTQGFQQNYLTEPDAIYEKGKQQISVSVSPNPSAKIFNVKIEGEPNPVLWQLINVYGNVISSEIEMINNFSINITQYPKGIYYLKLTQEDMQTVKKLILQ
jgi:hypothetical protein